MKNHYKTLEIPKTASAQEIKRAYFGMVKRYPPERFPEEFKEIRAAYETLSDATKRAEYDGRSELPDLAEELLGNAMKNERAGKRGEAIALLEAAEKGFPEYPVIKAERARMLERDGKYGLAMKIWEELREKEPEKAEYRYKLAATYERRGWRKKAEKEFEASLAINGGDAEVWLEYLSLINNGPYTEAEARLVCRKAIKAVKEAGRESLLLYAVGVELFTENDAEEGLSCLLAMKPLMRSRAADERDEYAVALALNGVMDSGNYRMFAHVRELAELLPNVDGTLKDLLDEASLVYDIETIGDNGFDPVFHDLFAVRHEDCDCDNCRGELLAMEFHILNDLTGYRPQINRLKKEFPRLYQLHGSFLDEVVRTRDPERMLHNRAKEIAKLGKVSGVSADTGKIEYYSQPVRREEPKVGRNDLCPCGSGKKYKKCCGANA